MMAIMMAVGLMGLMMMMEKEPDWDGRTFSTLTESLSLVSKFTAL